MVASHAELPGKLRRRGREQSRRLVPLVACVLTALAPDAYSVSAGSDTPLPATRARARLDRGAAHAISAVSITVASSSTLLAYSRSASGSRSPHPAM